MKLPLNVYFAQYEFPQSTLTFDDIDKQFQVYFHSPSSVIFHGACVVC